MKTTYEKLLGHYNNQVANLILPNAGFAKLLFNERKKVHAKAIQDLESERACNCKSAHEAAIALSYAVQSPLTQTKKDFNNAVLIAARRDDE